LEKNKEDAGLLSKSLEEAMIAKCGETTETLRAMERPLYKSHFRFFEPSSEAASAVRGFSSMEEEREVRRTQYESKISPVLEKKQPKLETVKEEKKLKGFLVLLEDTRKTVATGRN
jgi:hypothetical protein